MNKDYIINVLIPRIKRSKSFYMGVFTHVGEKEYNFCETPACIAGHCLTKRDFKKPFHIRPAFSDTAQERMGITHVAADLLFFPKGFEVKLKNGGGTRHISMIEITARHAVACLENLVKTGRVAWAKTAPKGEYEYKSTPVLVKLED